MDNKKKLNEALEVIIKATKEAMEKDVPYNYIFLKDAMIHVGNQPLTFTGGKLEWKDRRNRWVYPWCFRAHPWRINRSVAKSHLDLLGVLRIRLLCSYKNQKN